ncbi:MAG: hypothetical protein KGS48_16225, partial [Bacteroidetes bacterium]|nr:hypothetical protein [Bacteroidota bacterium]
METLNNPNPNFFEIQQAFKNYWAGKTIQKGKGYKAFKRWEWYWERRVNPDGTFPDAALALKGLNEAKQMAGTANKFVMTPTWSPMGPTTTPGGYAGLGRVNAIAFHPSNTNTFWLGSPSGGLWKTTDGGLNWTTNTDNFSVLGISGIVVTPSNPNIMYVATGDGDAGDNYSIGVLKSTDGGSTWSSTGLTFPVSSGVLIRRLVMDPNDETQLFVASTSGIYRTVNSGTSWTQVQSGNFYDLEAQPGATSNNFYAATGSSIYRSTDNGATWSNVQTISGSGRIALGITAADNTNVVALCSAASNSGFLGLYRSTNSGASYTLQSSTPNLLGYEANGSDTGGQGWYDLVVTIDPTNANVIFVGGVNIWKSTDAGVTWTLNTFWYNNPPYNEMHADKHAFEWQNNTTLFCGNDGGIYKTTNGGTSWTDLSSTLAISQLYRIGVSQTTNAVVAGLQDNGTKFRNNAGTWSDVIGGDGMECIIDFSNAQYAYGELYYGEIYRSSNSGASFPTNISANIPGGMPTDGAWITPYILSPSNSATIIAGYADVYKSTNRGNTWTKISNNLTGGTSLQSLAEAPSNSNYLYAATYSTLYRTINGGTSWSTMTIPSAAGNLTYISVHPTDPNTIFVSMSNYSAGKKVYKSTNGGSTWTNISGTLPNLPANCVIYQNTTNDLLYVGMDVGVYYKDNNMSDWAVLNTGLPNVEIDELEIRYSTGKIRAATYGRGLWETDVQCSAPTVSAPSVTQPTCAANSGAITVNATGVGTLEYSINNGSTWQTGSTFTSLAAGSYNIVVRLQAMPSCSTAYASNPVVLTAPTAPTVNAPTVTQPTCT